MTGTKADRFNVILGDRHCCINSMLLSKDNLLIFLKTNFLSVSHKNSKKIFSVSC